MFRKVMKLKLSPIERDILYLLEEAGAEDYQTLLVSLPTFTKAEVDQARQSLLKAGFISEVSSEVILTDAGRETLTR
jgi:hypothetical protein